MVVMELPYVADWLSDVLNAETAITAVFGTRIYAGSLAPQDATLPYLLYFNQSALDTFCLPASARDGVDTVYMIKGVADTSQYYAQLQPGMNGVETAMEDLTAVVGSLLFTVTGSTSAVEYEEVEPGGPVVVHLGRSWQIAVEPV